MLYESPSRVKSRELSGNNLSLRNVITFATITALALAVRFLLAEVLDWQRDFATGDSGWYLAGDLRDGFRAPGYPLFIRAIGPSLVLPAQAALSLVGAATAWLALRSHDRRLATLASAMMALSPLPVPIELRVLSETLYGFLVLLSVLCLFRFKSEGSSVVAGILMAAAILSRDSLMLLPVFILPFLSKRRGAIFLIVTALTTLPWYITHPGQGRAGFALWVGTWERSPDWQAKGEFPDTAFTSPADKERLVSAFNKKDFSPFGVAALTRMKAEPAYVIGSWAVRYPRLWLSTRTELNTVKSARLAVKVSGYALNIVLLIFGLFGALRASKEYRIFGAPIVYGAVSLIPFHNTEPRYILFTLPFFTIFAALELLSLHDYLRRKHVR